MNVQLFEFLKNSGKDQVKRALELEQSNYQQT